MHALGPVVLGTVTPALAALLLSVSSVAAAQSLVEMPDEPPIQGAEGIVARAPSIETLAAGDPDLPRARLDLARAYDALGRRTEAIRMLAVIARDHPGHEPDDVQYRLALALERTGQPDRARQVWLYLLQHHPQSPYVQAAYVVMADHQLREGHEAEGRSFLERALRIRDGRWEAYARYRLAWLRARAHEGAAIDELERASAALARPDQLGAGVAAAIARDRPAVLAMLRGR